MWDRRLLVSLCNISTRNTRIATLFMHMCYNLDLLGTFVFHGISEFRQPGDPVRDKYFHPRLCAFQRTFAVQSAGLDDYQPGVSIRLSPKSRATVSAKFGYNNFATVGRFGEYLRSALGHLEAFSVDKQVRRERRPGDLAAVKTVTQNLVFD